MITPNTAFIATCPCCGKPMQVQLIETDGVMAIGLCHISQDATQEEIDNCGYAFGVVQGEEGEVQIGKCEDC